MDERVSRQQFLQSLGRGGLLVGLGGLGAAALHGTRDPSECFNHNYCNSCFAYDGCTLPERKVVKNERTNNTRPA